MTEQERAELNRQIVADRKYVARYPEMGWDSDGPVSGIPTGRVIGLRVHRFEGTDWAACLQMMADYWRIGDDYPGRDVVFKYDRGKGRR